MDSKPAAYAVALGRNLAVARTRLDLNQEDVAERMRHLGFAAWARATVSKSERGTRPVTTAEVVGLALALRTTVPGLMAPGDQHQELELQEGKLPVPAESLVKLATGFNDGSITWDRNKPVPGPGKSGWYAGDPDAPESVKARWAEAEDES